jgi:hypothetical protein
MNTELPVKVKDVDIPTPAEARVYLRKRQVKVDRGIVRKAKVQYGAGDKMSKQTYWHEYFFPFKTKEQVEAEKQQEGFNDIFK